MYGTQSRSPGLMQIFRAANGTELIMPEWLPGYGLDGYYAGIEQLQAYLDCLSKTMPTSICFSN